MSVLFLIYMIVWPLLFILAVEVIYKELQKTNRLLVSINSYQTNSVDRTMKLREAVKLALSLLDLEKGVPYKTVSQKDIDFLKAALADSETTIPRPATVQEVKDGKAKWCSVCDADCPNKGKDLRRMCERFEDAGATVVAKGAK